MSDWSRIAQDAIEVAFGSDGRPRLQHMGEGRAVVWVENGVRDVLAMAGGITSVEAWRLLIQMCYRDDHRPTTGEVAAILGVNDSRVRQMVQSGTLIPDEAGNSGKPARYSPDEVYKHFAEKVG